MYSKLEQLRRQLLTQAGNGDSVLLRTIDRGIREAQRETAEPFIIAAAAAPAGGQQAEQGDGG